jgi:hypothetical protein
MIDKDNEKLGAAISAADTSVSDQEIVDLLDSQLDLVAAAAGSLHSSSHGSGVRNVDREA